MAKKIYGLTKAQLDRLKKSNERVERKVDRAKKPSWPLSIERPIWAELGECDSTTGRYSWTGAMYFDGTMQVSNDYGFADNEDEQGYAVCIYENSTNCLENSMVRLNPARSGKHFLFDYPKTSGGTTAEVIASDGTGEVSVDIGEGKTQTVVAKNEYGSSVEASTHVEMGFRDDGLWHITGADC